MGILKILSLYQIKEMDWPELRGDGRGSGEVSKLGPNALKEEPRQALAVDCRNTRGC